MKFRELSSGCEARPIKAEPGRSVASLGVVAVMCRFMRRHASVWAVGLQPSKASFQDAQGLPFPEGSSCTARIGRGCVVSGEVFDHGTQEEDRLVTRETQASPRRTTRPRRVARTQISNELCVRGVTRNSAKKRHRREVGRKQGEPELWPKGDWESEDCIGAEKWEKE